MDQRIYPGIQGHAELQNSSLEWLNWILTGADMLIVLTIDTQWNDE